MTDPSVGIKDLLVTAGVGVFAATTGTGIFIAKEPPSDQASNLVVTVYNTPGQVPNPKFLLDFPAVQVRVRGVPNGYTVSRQKAQDVKDALLGLPSQTLNGDRWVAINGVGDIFDAGFDENDRPMHTVNFDLIIEPATGTNRIPL